MAKQSNKKTFGQLLREKRIAKSYSLRKFAKEADISPTYLSQVEQDKISPPTADRIKRIAELLDESVDEWMAYADRLADELPDIIHSDPAVPDLLRAVQGMTPEQLKKVRAAADKIRESGETYQ
jgi:transcriptional regulator with XRE-family HTH domain